MLTCCVYTLKTDKAKYKRLFTKIYYHTYPKTIIPKTVIILDHYFPTVFGGK